MPRYKCPYPECTYETDEAEGQLAATLLSIHSAGAHNHTQVGGGATNATSQSQNRESPTPNSVRSGLERGMVVLRNPMGGLRGSPENYRERQSNTVLECCDEPLRKDLTRNAGGSLTNKSVEEVMAAIKRLAVREENTMVARVQLHNMHQDRDETIRSFGARLRGQAFMMS